MAGVAASSVAPGSELVTMRCLMAIAAAAGSAVQGLVKGSSRRNQGRLPAGRCLHLLVAGDTGSSPVSPGERKAEPVVQCYIDGGRSKAPAGVTGSTPVVRLESPAVGVGMAAAAGGFGQVKDKISLSGRDGRGEGRQPFSAGSMTVPTADFFMPAVQRESGLCVSGGVVGAG